MIVWIVEVYGKYSFSCGLLFLLYQVFKVMVLDELEGKLLVGLFVFYGDEFIVIQEQIVKVFVV